MHLRDLKSAPPSRLADRRRDRSRAPSPGPRRLSSPSLRQPDPKHWPPLAPPCPGRDPPRRPRRPHPRPGNSDTACPFRGGLSRDYRGCATSELTLRAQEIVEAHRRGTEQTADGLSQIIECGRALIEAKALVRRELGPRRWETWIASALPFGPREARRYMRLAQHEEELRKHPDRGTWGIGAACRILAEPHRRPTGRRRPSTKPNPQTAYGAPGERFEFERPSLPALITHLGQQWAPEKIQDFEPDEDEIRLLDATLPRPPPGPGRPRRTRRARSRRPRPRDQAWPAPARSHRHRGCSDRHRPPTRSLVGPPANQARGLPRGVATPPDRGPDRRHPPAPRRSRRPHNPPGKLRRQTPVFYDVIMHHPKQTAPEFNGERFAAH